MSGAGGFIKKFLNFTWREFIYGGHLTALGAPSIAFTSAILLDIPITWDFLLIVYLITYTVYLYNRFKEFNEDFLTNPNRTQHIGGYIKYTPLIIFCFTLVIIGMLLRFGNFLSLIFGLLLLFLGVLYSIYLKKVTKKIVGFKNFYVTFIWSLLVIFVGLYYNAPLNLSLFLFFSFVFLRGIINTVFFDIKDIETDKKNGLKTIPVLVGRKKTLIYLYIINIISFMPIILGVYKDIFLPFSLSLIVLYFYSCYYLQRAKSEKAEIQNLPYILVDGEYLFWPLILLSTKIIIGL